MLVPILSESLEIGSAGSDNSGAGGGSHLLKSPVGEHQNMPQLICLHPVPASWLPGWLPITLGSVFPKAPKASTLTPPPGAGSSAVPGFPGLGKGFGVGLAGLVVVSRGGSK